MLFRVIFESNDSIAQEKTISNATSSTLVDGLAPGANYKVCVATVGDDGDFSAYNTSNVVTGKFLYFCLAFLDYSSKFSRILFSLNYLRRCVVFGMRALFKSYYRIILSYSI